MAPKPFIGYTGTGNFEWAKADHSTIDRDFGIFGKVNLVEGGLVLRIEDYQSEWVSMYIRIPIHPGPKPYPNLFLSPIIVVSNVPAFSSFEQMEDIDGWPHFKVSFLLIGYTSYQHNPKMGMKYVDVSISYMYPYQPTFSAPPSAVVGRPISSGLPMKFMESLSTSVQIIRSTNRPKIGNQTGVTTYVESGIQEYDSAQELIIGSITSIDAPYGHIYHIELRSIFQIVIDDDPKPVIVVLQQSWIRDTTILTIVNSNLDYISTGSRSITQTPSGLIPNENISIIPSNLVNNISLSYSIVPVNEMVIKKVGVTSEIKITRAVDV